MKPWGFSAPQRSKVLRGSFIFLLLFKITCCSNSAPGTRDGRPGKPPVLEEQKKCRKYQGDENEVSLEEHSPASCIRHCSDFNFAMFHVAEVHTNILPNPMSAFTNYNVSFQVENLNLDSNTVYEGDDMSATTDIPQDDDYNVYNDYMSEFRSAMFHGDQCKCRNEHPTGDTNKDGCNEMGGKGNKDTFWWDVFSTEGQNIRLLL